MIEAHVWVDEERLGEFYELVGRFLQGEVAPTSEPALTEVAPWGDSPEDYALAKVVWGKLSERARDLVGKLADQPNVPEHSEKLAEELTIPNGKYGVAGVLAWPGRHCAAVGRPLPIEVADGGEAGALYVMKAEVAKLFTAARDAK